MKAIRTKVLHSTNFRPTRIKAMAEGVKPLTISYEDEWNSSRNHLEVARRLCERQKWQSWYQGGTLPDGSMAWVAYDKLDGAFNSNFDGIG